MLLDTIQINITQAMKDKDSERLTALRGIKAALDKVIKEKGSITPDAEVKVLESMYKRHQESITAFKAAGRNDLVGKEAFEALVVLEFLPTPATESEMLAVINEVVTESGLLGMGVVMKAVQAKLAGKRVDNKFISLKVKEALSNLPQY